jgi:hypothetical protein
MAFGAGMATRGQDPEAQRESIWHFGAMLQGVAAQLQQQQAQKRALGQAEVERFFREAQAMPELASTWGPDLSARLGKDYPEVPYLVNALKNRGDQTAQLKGGWDRYLAAVDTAKGHLSDMQAAANQLPDVINIPAQDGVGPPQQVPNPDKARLTQTLQQMSGPGVYRTALNSLSAEDEYGARIYAHSIDPQGKGPAGMLPPALTGFDPRSLGGGTAALAKMYLMTQGVEDPGQLAPDKAAEFQHLLKGEMGMEPKAAEVWKLGTQFQNNAALEGARHQHATDLELLRNKDTASRIFLSHQLLGQQEDVNFKRKVQLLDQQGKLMGLSDPYQVPAIATAAAQKDWEKRFSDAKLAGIPPAQLQALWRQRPTALPAGVGNQIADSVVSEVAMGLLDPSQATAETQQRTVGLQQILAMVPPGAKDVSQDAATTAITAGHRRVLAQWIGSQSAPQQYQARVLKAYQAYDAALKRGASPMAALQQATGVALPAPQARAQTRAQLRGAGRAAAFGGVAGSAAAQAPAAAPAQQPAAVEAPQAPEPDEE